MYFKTIAMNNFHDLKNAEKTKETTVREIILAVAHYPYPKKYKELFSFVGTVRELKSKLNI